MNTEAAFALWGAIGGITLVGVAVILGALIDTWLARRRLTKTYDQPDELQ